MKIHVLLVIFASLRKGLANNIREEDSLRPMVSEHCDREGLAGHLRSQGQTVC